MPIRFNNFAKKVEGRARLGDGRKPLNWYEWRVFVDEKPEVLDQISHVQYLLHPTFPNPLRVSDDRRSKFALESSGWGSFKIYITVRFKNGTEEEAEYFLDLNKEWPE